jgi:hypothetical protein
MANTLQAGYPVVFGNKRVGLVSHPGVSSYVAGGETLYPAAFGLKGFEAVFAMGSDDGSYIAEITTVTPTSCKVVWTVRTTGAEVAGATNLSARKVPIMAIGW